jgi:hypothetical protein
VFRPHRSRTGRRRRRSRPSRQPSVLQAPRRKASRNARQRGAQLIEPVRRGGKRAIFRFALAQCGFGLLPLAELHVDPRAKGFGIQARALGGVVDLSPHERFAGPPAGAEQAIAFVRSEISLLVKGGDEEADGPPGGRQRDGDGCAMRRQKVQDRNPIDAGRQRPRRVERRDSASADDVGQGGRHASTTAAGVLARDTAATSC